MIEAVRFACCVLGLTPAESLMAATVNSAFASGLGDDVGPLEPGKRADLLILNTPSYARLPYELADDPIRAVVKDGWLVVDGSLSESPDWAADLRTVGVSKSHAALPFDGPDLERYLRLPKGHRTSVFAPESRSVAPVLAWALRLWDWEARDLFHGLVRVEVAPPTAIPPPRTGSRAG